MLPISRPTTGAGRLAQQEIPMHKQIQPGAFLRTVLKADAAVSALAASTMILGAGMVAPVTGLPADALWLAGVALIPWVALLLWVATRYTVSPGAVWLVVALNTLGALACALIAFAVPMSTTGVGFVAVNGVGALLLADLEFVGLRRSPAAA